MCLKMDDDDDNNSNNKRFFLQINEDSFILEALKCNEVFCSNLEKPTGTVFFLQHSDAVHSRDILQVE